MKQHMNDRQPSEPGEFEEAVADQQAAEEVLVWTGAYSVRMFLPGLIAGLPITVVLFAIARFTGGKDENNALRYSLEGVLLLGWLLLLGFACFWVLGTEYMLTNKRLYCRRGFGHPGLPGTELVHFLDVRVQQSRLERWLRSGRLLLSVAVGSGPPCVLHGVADPERVAAIFRKHIREAHSRH